MDGSFLPLMMVAALVACIFVGYPVAFALAGIGVLFALITDIPLIFLFTSVSRIYSGVLTNWLLLAVPLFVFMGLMMEKSGIATRLLGSMARLLGPLPGGYAFAVAVLGIVMAASTGIIGASVVLMGLLALPVMIRNGYDQRIATGLIAASGTLGILIPPSVMLIILGDTLRVSVGDLFLGAAIPGLMLGGLYILYLIAVGIFQPHRMPPMGRADDRPFWVQTLELLRDLVAPLALVLTVLGSIVAGVATPTESAALGATGALILALASRRLKLADFAAVLRDTTKTTAMIIFVMIGATVFSGIFKRLGGDGMIEAALGVGVLDPYMILLVIMLLIFVLGLFLEWVEITLVVLPLVAPIVAVLDFGLGLSPQEQLVWFAILFAINLQTSFLTPPFGYALFYLKGIAPAEVKITTIYRGIVPFVLLQLTQLGLTVAFPALVLWLPRTLLG